MYGLHLWNGRDRLKSLTRLCLFLKNANRDTTYAQSTNNSAVYMHIVSTGQTSFIASFAIL